MVIIIAIISLFLCCAIGDKMGRFWVGFWIGLLLGPLGVFGMLLWYVFFPEHHK